MKYIHTFFLTLLLAISIMLPSCAAFQAKAQTVETTLDRIVAASEYLDAAWNAFCLFEPGICVKYGAQYQTVRGVLQSTLIAARDASGAIASDKADDVRKAYTSIEELLLKLGVVTPPGTVAASKNGWVAWTAPKI